MKKSKSVKSGVGEIAQLEMMNIIVFLVLALFAATAGYYIGRASVFPSPAYVRESAMMLKQQGAAMETTGKFVLDRGTNLGDKELINKGRVMIQDGSRMTVQGNGLMVE